MKAIGLLLLFSCSLLAESPFEHEMTQLGEQRTKEVSAAMEPINRRYKEALEALMRRATQAADLDAALKIRKLLGTMPAGNSTAASAAPPKAATAENPASRSDLAKKGLEQRLEKSNWVTPSKNWLRRMVIENGKVIVNPNEKGTGKAEPFHAVDGQTIVFELNGKPCSLVFSPDLSSCKRGTIPYQKKE